MIDNKLIMNYIKNKEYSKASNIIRDEIITILVENIKKQNSNFEYSTINNLKDEYLKLEESIYYDSAIDLYILSLDSKNELYNLNILREIYSNLKK